jgi:hypothetical protein
LAVLDALSLVFYSVGINRLDVNPSRPTDEPNASFGRNTAFTMFAYPTSKMCQRGKYVPEENEYTQTKTYM